MEENSKDKEFIRNHNNPLSFNLIKEQIEKEKEDYLLCLMAYQIKNNKSMLNKIFMIISTETKNNNNNNIFMMSFEVNFSSFLMIKWQRNIYFSIFIKGF